MIGACLLVLSLLAAPAAVAAPPTDPGAPLVWAAPVAVDRHPLDAIACPTARECVAVDHQGGVVTSLDPTGGARAWRGADVDRANFLTAIACPSSTECVATDNTGNVVTSSDVPAGAASWAVSEADPSTTQYQSDNAGPTLLRGIACPAVNECLAVDAAGNDAVSTNPTGGASTWTVSHIDTNTTRGCTGSGLACQPPLMGIACPSVTLCAAVDMSGNLLETGAPTATAPWGSEPADGPGTSSLWGIACPTAALCATVDGYDHHVITWNPSSPRLLAHHRLAGATFGIWCTSSALCLTASPTSHGTDDLLGSLDPAAARPTWSAMALGGINAVACPTPALCVAANDEGEIDVGVSASSLAAAMRAALFAHRPRLSIPGLLRRGGVTLPFTAPLPGSLELALSVPRPAPAGIGATPPLVVAGARAVVPAPGRVRLRLTPTPAGRRLLSNARQLTVTASAGFATSTSPVSVTRRLVLRVPPRRTRRRG